MDLDIQVVKNWLRSKYTTLWSYSHWLITSEQLEEAANWFINQVQEFENYVAIQKQQAEAIPIQESSNDST